MGGHLSLWYGHEFWYWSTDTVVWPLSIDHNMDVQYQAVGSDPILARKCEILYWLACGADGWVDDHMTTKISWMDR